MNKVIEGLTEKEVKSLLQFLIEALDEEDTNDVFGTEGWRHYFGLEWIGRE